MKPYSWIAAPALLVALILAVPASAQNQIDDIRAEIAELQAQIDSLNALLQELLQGQAYVIDSPTFNLASPVSVIVYSTRDTS